MTLRWETHRVTPVLVDLVEWSLSYPSPETRRVTSRASWSRWVISKWFLFYPTHPRSQSSFRVLILINISRSRFLGHPIFEIIFRDTSNRASTITRRTAIKNRFFVVMHQPAVVTGWIKSSDSIKARSTGRGPNLARCTVERKWRGYCVGEDGEEHHAALLCMCLRPYWCSAAQAQVSCPGCCGIDTIDIFPVSQNIIECSVR